MYIRNYGNRDEVVSQVSKVVERKADFQKLVEVKHGELPVPNVATDSYGLLSDWIIELLYEEHPEYDDEVFIVKMRNAHMPDSKPVFFPIGDLYDPQKKRKIIMNLRSKGLFEENYLDHLTHQVNNMIRNNMITADDGSYRLHIIKAYDTSVENDTERCYKAIVNDFKKNTNAYASKKQGNYDNERCYGLKLDDADSIREYGENAVAIKDTELRKIVKMSKNKLPSLLVELEKRNLLIPDFNGSYRKRVTMGPKIYEWCYIVKIDPSYLSEEGIGDE